MMISMDSSSSPAASSIDPSTPATSHGSSKCDNPSPLSASRFSESLDEVCGRPGCPSFNLCVTEHNPEDACADVFYDMPYIRLALDEVLRIGQCGNNAFQRRLFQEATRFYHVSLARLKVIDHINCNGLCKHSVELDATVTSIAFTTLINSAAAFLQFEAADCIACRLASQYAIALSCAEQAAAAALRNYEQHPGRCWKPSHHDCARMHKVKAVAYQRLGQLGNTLAEARRVLQYAPCDEGCKSFVARMQAAPPDPMFLCERLEDLLLQGEHGEAD